MKRRALLRNGSLVLLLGGHQIAFGAGIVAVRLWPAPEYTRLTIESDGVLASRVSSTAQNLYLDIDGLALDPTLRELVAKVRADDPFIAGIRILQHSATTVRLQVTADRAETAGGAQQHQPSDRVRVVGRELLGDAPAGRGSEYVHRRTEVSLDRVGVLGGDLAHRRRDRHSGATVQDDQPPLPAHGAHG